LLLDVETEPLLDVEALRARVAPFDNFWEEPVVRMDFIPRVILGRRRSDLVDERAWIRIIDLDGVVVLAVVIALAFMGMDVSGHDGTTGNEVMGMTLP